MNASIRRLSEFCLTLFITLLIPTMGGAAALSGPTQVAERYFEAMQSLDLDAAGKLFSVTSSVFESGGREGSWTEYREHHIGPENDQIKSFKIIRGEPETAASRDSSMAFVAWPIEYRIDLKDGKVVESRGTVTFMLVREGASEYRIRHLHWSSRRKPTVPAK